MELFIHFNKKPLKSLLLYCTIGTAIFLLFYLFHLCLGLESNHHSSNMRLLVAMLSVLLGCILGSFIDTSIFYERANNMAIKLVSVGTRKGEMYISILRFSEIFCRLESVSS